MSSKVIPLNLIKALHVRILLIPCKDRPLSSYSPAILMISLFAWGFTLYQQYLVTCKESTKFVFTSHSYDFFVCMGFTLYLQYLVTCKESTKFVFTSRSYDLFVCLGFYPVSTIFGSM